MTELQKACKRCKIVSTEETCPICGEKLSKKWQGYFILMDCESSIIGAKIGYRCDQRVIDAIHAATPDEAFERLGVDKNKLTHGDEPSKEEELKKMRQMIRCFNHCDALISKLGGTIKRGQFASCWRYALRVR